jgi:hypothetical protein
MNAYPAKPLDMDSAAEILGVSRRTLTDALKRLPHYELRGRKKVFYPEHIAQLRTGMHECASRPDGSTVGPMPSELVRMASESDSLSKLRTLAAQRKPART